MKKTSHVPLWLQITLNLLTIGIVASLLFTSRALAAPGGTSQVPGFIPYQGNLLNQSGNPVSGLIDMTFSLYAVPTSGIALWTEVHTSGNAVPVAGGLFNVNLGSITPIPADLWNQPDLYLGIRVGSDVEMSPRQPLGGVPSALQASVAQLALTVPDGSIGSQQIANGAVTSMKMAPTWYEASATTSVYTDKIDPQWESSGTSLSFDCETDCTAWIMHRGLIMATIKGTRVDVQIIIDNTTIVFSELGIYEWNFVPVSGYSIENLPAGNHTVSVRFTCSSFTPGATCIYYGDGSGGIWENLSVMLFAQEP